MSNARERDLVARCLIGDYQARVDLCQKFVYENPAVRRIGARYNNVEDFRHDCFTNVLRAAHFVPKASGLADWVESVAMWTALDRERRRDIENGSFVRMCAAMEAEEPDDPVLSSYFPPRSGADDSLTSRIAAIVGETQLTMMRVRAMPDSTWEQVAEAVGQPVHTVGPLLVRAVDRLSRFFGAPPPLNTELEHVFLDVDSERTRNKRSGELKVKGRVLSMRLDVPFYSATSDLRKIGVPVPSEVRTIMLWDAARASAPPQDALRDHLARCRYCSELLRSLLLMQQALLSGANADFLVCPGASTLMKDPDAAPAALSQHLAECQLCRDERTRALNDEEWGLAQADRIAESRLRKTAVLTAAAAIAVGGLFWIGHRHSAATEEDAVWSNLAPEPPKIVFNTKYVDLAQPISLDDRKVMASVRPRNQLSFMEALSDFKDGKLPDAMILSSQLANKEQDPGAQLLFAVCLYRQQARSEGYHAMLKAEAMPPRDSFRCWVTLQCALTAGDTAIAKREVEHLASDPEYGSRAKVLLSRILARK